MEDENFKNVIKPHIFVERTLAIIKPDAFHKSEEIEECILKNGFYITHVSYLYVFLFD